MTELQFLDEQNCASDVRDYDSIFRPEREILGPRSKRAYPRIDDQGNKAE